MVRQFRKLLPVVLLIATACASHPARSPLETMSVPATQPLDPKALLTLDQITPIPQLALPSTRPTTRPSLEALVYYAKARDAMTEGNRFTAISSLEKAIALDSTNDQLLFDLGKAYIAAATVDDRAIEAFEQAALLQPDNAETQIALGRQYLAKNDLVRGIRHLRLAMQTSGYADDDGEAALTDYLLARALKEAGYDRAALDEYDVLLGRLKDPSLAIRQNQELSFVLSRPELLYLQIGQLYERNYAYEQALQAYQPAADHDPGNFDLQAKVTRMLASLGRRDQALAKSSALILSSNASPDSLALLRDVCNRLKLPGGNVAALTQLHNEHPLNRPVLSSLVDALIARNRSSDAEKMLESAWQESPGDVQLTRRLVAMDVQRGAVDEAARILVLSLAHQPDSLGNLVSMWGQLLRPGQKNRFHLETLQAMRFAPEIEPAREFWVSRIAELNQRDALSHSALEQSVKSIPPFPPAYRALLNQTWLQDELSDQQKIDASEQLASAAAAGGNISLAIEIRGLSLLHQKQPAAATSLAQAIQQGGTSPDLHLEYAIAVRQAGRDPKFEEIMWKLVTDYPLYDEGYALLFRYYADPTVASINQAMKVMGAWLQADPQSITARVIGASVDSQTGQTQQAERGFDQLFAEEPDNPEVLEGIRSFYAQAGKVDTFISKLEDYRAKHRQDTMVVAILVSTYADQKRIAEAVRILDATRVAVAEDADLLYNVAQLYTRVDQKRAAEDVLEQVVRLDANHAGASNDLGYEWADEGRNLSDAESLIRVAVSAEPDNQSFLDSLGWVLYKRGKFDEARKYLELAVGPAAFPDPVVLNHLGDTLYRLALDTDAAKQWQRSLKGIGDGIPERDDLKQLRLQLLQKLKESDSKKPVEVAPVIESSTAAQAKQ